MVFHTVEVLNVDSECGDVVRGVWKVGFSNLRCHVDEGRLLMAVRSCQVSRDELDFRRVLELP